MDKTEYYESLRAMALVNYPQYPNSAGGLGAAGVGVGGGLVNWPGMQQAGPLLTEDDTLLQMIASRMRWPSAYSPPFRKIVAHRLTPDTVAVFVAVGGKAVVIEDGFELFPSDTLVTQLRLLEEK